MKSAWRSTFERTECTEWWLLIPLLTWSDIAFNLYSLWECLKFCLFVSGLLSSHGKNLKETEVTFLTYAYWDAGDA